MLLFLLDGSIFLNKKTDILAMPTALSFSFCVLPLHVVMLLPVDG
jgi:hypothetical protein